jgi:hypothetical protein
MMQDKMKKIKYNYESLNVDQRFIEIQEEFAGNGLEFVLVKGIVWNRGALLEGADVDFYARQSGQFLDYDCLPDNCRRLIEDSFKGVLVSPRKTDFESAARSAQVYLDAEMVAGKDYAELLFANKESREFFESGHFDCPESFEPNIFLLRFVLNRFLEETGSERTISAPAYSKLVNFSDESGNKLYSSILSCFPKKGDVFCSPGTLPYHSLVLEGIAQKRPRQDFIYIKPLHKALEEIENDKPC